MKYLMLLFVPFLAFASINNREAFPDVNGFDEIQFSIPENFTVERFSPCQGGNCGTLVKMYLVGDEDVVNQVSQKPELLSSKELLPNSLFFFTFYDSCVLTAETIVSMTKDACKRFNGFDRESFEVEKTDVNGHTVYYVSYNCNGKYTKIFLAQLEGEKIFQMSYLSKEEEDLTAWHEVLKSISFVE